MKMFLALSHPDVVFIMLIKVKMPTNYFNMYEQDYRWRFNGKDMFSPDVSPITYNISFVYKNQ